MKKLLLAALLLLNPVTIFAAGPFDGIYAVSFNGSLLLYASVHETDNQVIIVTVSPDPTIPWEPMSGTRSENSVSLTNIPGISPSDIQISVTVNFNLNATSTATIDSCVNGVSYICQLPPGITLNLDKVI